MDGFDLQSLPVNLLQSKAQDDLLACVSELRNIGFNHRVLLPQLVLCGEQNCGKSSVFEAITGIALPINDGICTRFATEVTFRKSSCASAHVKMRPGPNSSPDHRRKLCAFSRPHAWLRDIATLFSEARLIMGLTQDDGYSQDVLQLEVSGPSLPDLTVIDLPGLLLGPGPDQTQDDVIALRQLTEYYMNNPRNIVLAIVSAEVPLSQQLVLQMISSSAPRTMGIVTKPEILDPDSGVENSFYACLKDQDSSLKLGWHLLKCTDTNEKIPSGLAIEDIESMFTSSVAPWKDLPPDVAGRSALRNRLSKSILGQAELQLTTLASGIQKDLEACRATLEQLGPYRTNGAERRSLLTRIGERFTTLTKEGTCGEYHDFYFRYHLNYPKRRLRSILQIWAENFASDMEARGHSYHILSDFTIETSQSARSPLSPEDPRPITRSEFVKQLSDLLKQNKSHEISGRMNAQVVGELFTQYAIKWSSMAKAHVFEVWKKVKLFLDDVLHYVAGGSVGGVIVREILNHDMEERLQKLNQKIEELSRPYKRTIPATVNRQLNTRIKELRRKSGEQRVEDDPVIADNNDFSLCSELLDCMLAYYSVALGVFIDNIANLAVEDSLINGLEDLLSPTRITQMSDEEIERLTAGSEDIELSRNHVTRRIRLLELASAACTKCEMNALESAVENYRATSTDRSTRHSTPTVSSATSSFSSASPTADGDNSSPGGLPRVTSKSPKPTKQSPTTTVLRAFPPAKRPPEHTALPQLPLNGTEQSPLPENGNCISSSPVEKPPYTPPPQVPPIPRKSVSRSLSLNSEGSRSQKNTGGPKSPKIGHRRKISKLKPVAALFDDKQSGPSPITSVGIYTHMCEFLDPFQVYLKLFHLSVGQL